MRKIHQGNQASLHGQLAPPPLEPALVRLWHREFDRFPAGYFMPADVSGMRVYLETLAEYEAARLRVQRARSVHTKREERKELRAITRPLLALMRALRMFSSTRTHPATMGRLASAPAKQVAPASDGPAWRTMMRDAGSVKPS